MSGGGNQGRAGSCMIRPMSRMRAAGSVTGAIIALAAIDACSSGLRPPAVTSVTRPWQNLVREVEVQRTAHGVPHIIAQNLAALGYGEAYVQSEDYGPRVALSLLRARGEVAKWYGHDSIAADFSAVPAYRRAVETYGLIARATRDVYEGFAAGVNRYIELQPRE